MSVISGADYKAIAISYAQAYEAISGASQHLYDAAYSIMLLDQYEPEVELLGIFDETYRVNAQKYSSFVTYLGAVRALNNHVLNNNTEGYTSIDDFIVEEVPGGVVPSGWATLCEAAGFHVTHIG